MEKKGAKLQGEKEFSQDPGGPTVQQAVQLSAHDTVPWGGLPTEDARQT